MSTDPHDLDGDVALVTGASSGIGRATAKTLADAGAAVAVTARRTDRIETLAEEIESEGGEALAITADVTETDDVERMIERTREELGGLDILVNNAGVMLLAPVIRADLDDLQQMLDVNLMGLMAATRTALPGMLEQDSGHIVNISSVAGRRANEASGGYSATKFGVNAFSESLRKETADSGVRVTVIEPGAVDTELGQHIPDEQVMERMAEMVQDMTVLQPEDIAAAIRYAVTQPPRVSVNELLVRPTDQRS
ncbi:SDR family oxidoreductase [Halorientalis pallida]|uniref:SDR family oxidoreductase n=1 Tax=Halorientalis pallida TaxID=2479928 RepID=UPI003C6FB9A5